MTFHDKIITSHYYNNIHKESHYIQLNNQKIQVYSKDIIRVYSIRG